MRLILQNYYLVIEFINILFIGIDNNLLKEIIKSQVNEFIKLR